MFPVSQTELLPVVSENAQKTQKNTERAKKCKKWNVGLGVFFSSFSPFFFFFAKILKAVQTHKSEQLTVTKHSSAVKNPKAYYSQKVPITFQSLI